MTELSEAQLNEPFICLIRLNGNWPQPSRRTESQLLATSSTLHLVSEETKLDPQQLDECSKRTRGVKFERFSKYRNTSEDYLAPMNSLKGSTVSDFEQQRRNRISYGTDNHNASDNLFLYSHLGQHSIPQANRCFTFPRLPLTPESSSDVNSESNPNCQLESYDVLQTGKLTRISRSSSSNSEKKCRNTKLVQAERFKKRKRKLEARNRGYKSAADTVVSRTDYFADLIQKISSPVLQMVRRSSRKSEYKIADVAETQKSAVEKLALGSVDTMAVTAVPLDCWLKERLKRWVQLSGHEGSMSVLFSSGFLSSYLPAGTIVPATDKTLWKRRSCNSYNEGDAYRSLMNDPALQPFVPRYYREVEYKNESFIEIEDLTTLFDDPAIMDIKMGTRTFLESDVNSTTARSDLYAKMVSLNPYEPTEEEHAAKAVTKTRYMQFREKESSSGTLGYRIEAAKMPGGVLQKGFKKMKTRGDISAALLAFFGQQLSTAGLCILRRLKRLREAAQKSLFFRTHEVIGSSLLLMYDATYANVWMIDFAKSIPVEIDSINHRQEWVCGNHEDGYFIGLDNLIEILEELVL
uniref:Kinase n=1 Tax=Setaria digitata TaxID=48799 RepID=A0A915PXR7_9BILA